MKQATCASDGPAAQTQNIPVSQLVFTPALTACPNAELRMKDKTGASVHKKTTKNINRA